jgi:hypothetical protein
MAHGSFKAVDNVAKSRPAHQNNAMARCKSIGIDRLRLADPVYTAGENPLAVLVPDGTTLATVCPLTTRAVALGARLYSVPETVTLGAPGRIGCVPTNSAVDEGASERIWPPLSVTTAGAPGVRVWEPMTRGLGATMVVGVEAWLTGIVLVPTMMAVGMDARLTGVPDTVTAGAPGVRIWLSTTMSTAEVVVGDGARAGV